MYLCCDQKKMVLNYREKKMEQSLVQSEIEQQCNFIKNFLIDKNKKYGNSAIEPKRIFSKVATIEQINVSRTPCACVD